MCMFCVSTSAAVTVDVFAGRPDAFEVTLSHAGTSRIAFPPVDTYDDAADDFDAVEETPKITLHSKLQSNIFPEDAAILERIRAQVIPQSSNSSEGPAAFL